MTTNIRKIVASAIYHRRRLFIRYNGQDHARVIEPHVLYRMADGMLALVAYQVRGYQSSDRRGTFWRPFQLNKIDSISAINETYSPRIRQGYETVLALTRGEILSKLVVRPEEYVPPHRSLHRDLPSRPHLRRTAQTKKEAQQQAPSRAG